MKAMQPETRERRNRPQLMERLDRDLLKSTYDELQSGTGAIKLWRRLSEVDRRRLGGDFDDAVDAYRPLDMWIKLRGVGPKEALVEAALAAGIRNDSAAQDLRRILGIEDNDPDLVMARAIADGHLVLDEMEREIYFESVQINLAWRHCHVPWNYVWLLCKMAKGGSSLKSSDFGDGTRENFVSQTKSTLTDLEGFPGSLDKLLEPQGDGAVRLNLAPQKIRIFEHIGPLARREWHP